MPGGKGSGAKKHGRNTKSTLNSRYKAEGRHAKSHLERLLKHLRRHPEDLEGRKSFLAFGGREGVLKEVLAPGGGSGGG